MKLNGLSSDFVVRCRNYQQAPASLPNFTHGTWFKLLPLSLLWKAGVQKEVADLGKPSFQYDRKPHNPDGGSRFLCLVTCPAWSWAALAIPDSSPGSAVMLDRGNDSANSSCRLKDDRTFCHCPPFPSASSGVQLRMEEWRSVGPEASATPKFLFWLGD